jgi:hypothetical protein
VPKQASAISQELAEKTARIEHDRVDFTTSFCFKIPILCIFALLQGFEYNCGGEGHRVTYIVISIPGCSNLNRSFLFLGESPSENNLSESISSRPFATCSRKAYDSR